jgi:hypothetical protein
LRSAALIGVDFSRVGPGSDAVTAAGYGFVCPYLWHDNTDRTDRIRTEADDYIRNGVGVVPTSPDKVASQQQEQVRQHTEILTALDADKTALDNGIERLRAFEGDYRTHLMRFLHAQLRELDGQEPAGPADPISAQPAPRHPRLDLHRTNPAGDLRWAHKSVLPTRAKAVGAQQRDRSQAAARHTQPTSSATDTRS